MVFYTDQDQYVGDLTDGAGIRVVVHNQTDMPFPEDESVAVSPGTLTYIGASLVSLSFRRLINVLRKPLSRPFKTFIWYTGFYRAMHDSA